MRKIVVLGTGGTIAGRSDSAADNVGYRAAQVGVADLVQSVPGLANVAIETEQVAQVDSKDMDFAVWRELALRCAYWLARPEVQGVVVTHGTDTMEETAYFLEAVLAPGKPVVLTGAMRPATSVAPDGPQNLAEAILVAATAGVRGVSVAFAGSVHAARDVVKVHSYRPDAFGSGEAGPVAVVEEGALRLLRTWPEPAAGRTTPLPDPADWPAVEIVLNHAGAGGVLVDALVAQGVSGLVVAGTGNGTIHREREAALLRAQEQGVAVRRCTRCPQGRVIPQAADRLPVSDLSPVKTRVALLLELMP